MLPLKKCKKHYYSRSSSRVHGERKRDVQHPCHCELLIASLGTSFCSRNHSLAEMQLHNLYRSLIAKRGACAISSLRSLARAPLSTPLVKHAERHFLFLSSSVEWSNSLFFYAFVLLPKLGFIWERFPSAARDHVTERRTVWEPCAVKVQLITAPSNGDREKDKLQCHFLALLDE